MPRKIVGRGEEESFERSGLGREIANQRRITGRKEEVARRHELTGFEVARDIKYGFAFAHDERLLIDLAGGNFPENLAPGHWMIEEILEIGRASCRERV